MTEFWSGVASTLVGALAGGFASWLAARVQVRGAIAVAQMQNAQSIEAQRLLRREALKHDAAVAYSEFGDRLFELLDELKLMHQHPTLVDGKCPEHPRPTQARVLFRESSRLKHSYEAAVHPHLTEELNYIDQFLWDISAESDPAFESLEIEPADGSRCHWLRAVENLFDRVDYLAYFLRIQLNGEGLPLRREEHRNLPVIDD
ncbi:hypothetical protein [Micromonospora sp. NBC_01813]|uniref:hypothetical protein n=1 Tax=Micromonospora sp. NBC_01813 TaxID=2975988 RepID=UPI002DD93D85|nr:hypothetical protein [Micromonospora sp. NBC_01813]WSA06897.1 hypothetical protein OG958_21845 [Micromonospora sp. NBC_01813]